MSVYAGPADWWTDGTNGGRTHIATKGIVQSGLVLNLDAGVSSSYPGSGTTWTDLSGNNHSTLINGPTFHSSSGIRMDFDGSNDYAEVITRNTALEFQPTQSFSVFCWLYNPTYIGAGAIVANMLNGSGYPGWDLWKNAADKIAVHLIKSWSSNAIKVQVTFNYTNYTNKWVNLGFVYDGTCPTNSTNAVNSIIFYVDGTTTITGKSIDGGADGFDTSNETIVYDATQRLRVGSRFISLNASSPTNANVGCIQIYNRALSATEVQQNFNALRGRYGV
jgi:hypothetical protein